MSDQFWGTEQKFTFTPLGGSTLTLGHNPKKYSSQPASQADLQIPAKMGPGLLQGGLQYAPTAIPLQWDELDRDDYLALANIELTFCKMVDMEDQGFWGWLKLGNFDWQPGPTKKGSASAVFMCSGPASGVSTVVNTLAAPTGITFSQASPGGAIANTTHVYHWLTFSSDWGETTAYAYNRTYTAGSSYGTHSWTAPTSAFYRRARLYASAAGDGSQPIYVMGDVMAAQTQQWTDYNGLTQLDKIVPVPTVNTASTGQWRGGIWQNLA